jgi:hypothetical protein
MSKNKYDKIPNEIMLSEVVRRVAGTCLDRKLTGEVMFCMPKLSKEQSILLHYNSKRFIGRSIFNRGG